MIHLKTEKEISIMAEAGRILAKIIDELKNNVSLGVTTNELNRAAQVLILEYKAEPAFLNYQGFPAALCASVNSQIVHGLPSDYQLKSGDLLSLDLGIKYQGFYSDMAITFLVESNKGQTPVNFEALRLIKAAKKALKLGIKKARPGNTFGDIGNTIQRFVEHQGFNVIRDLCGHGIGRDLHEEPKVLNYGERHKREKIKPGMVFCIEPMIAIGDWHLKKSKDGFGYETKDGSLSAHFEHTVAILENRQKVLTKI